jgi:hypothetical protein
MIDKSLKVSAYIALAGASAFVSTAAQAWSCETTFKEAMTQIEAAEALVDENTDSRILGMIAEAKGIAEAGIVSHRKSNEGHTKEVGKYRHSDAITKGREAQLLAKQAKFLITGETY